MNTKLNGTIYRKCPKFSVAAEINGRFELLIQSVYYGLYVCHNEEMHQFLFLLSSNHLLFPYIRPLDN